MYHDESLPIRNQTPFTGHGLLYVRDERVPVIAQQLRELRDGYRGEIHFAEIKGDSGQQAQFRVATRWIEFFFTSLVAETPFKATVALHEGPKPLPYPDDGFSYLRHMLAGTRHTFVGLTRFALTGYDSIDVDPVFDDTGNARIRDAYQWAVDQFAHRATQRRLDGDKRYPIVKAGRARFVTSDPAAAAADEADDCELVQLTDVLLGAAQQALELSEASRHSGRVYLAQEVAAGMAKYWGRSRLRYSVRARNFTVSLWPDRFGFLYPALPARRLRQRHPRSALPVLDEWMLRGGSE